MKQEPTRALADLRAEYISRVNTVLESGREDLAYELADTYQADRMEVLANRRARWPNFRRWR